MADLLSNAQKISLAASLQQLGDLSSQLESLTSIHEAHVKIMASMLHGILMIEAPKVDGKAKAIALEGITCMLSPYAHTRMTDKAERGRSCGPIGPRLGPPLDNQLSDSFEQQSSHLYSSSQDATSVSTPHPHSVRRYNPLGSRVGSPPTKQRIPIGRSTSNLSLSSSWVTAGRGGELGIEDSFSSMERVLCRENSLERLEKVSWVRQQSFPSEGPFSDSIDERSEVHFANETIDEGEDRAVVGRNSSPNGSRGERVSLAGSTQRVSIAGSTEMSSNADSDKRSTEMDQRSTVLSRLAEDPNPPRTQLLEIWATDGQFPSHPSLIRGQSWKVDSDMGIRFTDDTGLQEPGILDSFVLLPGSLKRLFWEIAGMLLILYDLIVIPLQVFDTEDNYFTKTMDWVAIMYWTFDIPLSFFVGFHSKGVVIVRVPAIASRYLQSWFIFDVTVIAFDWVISIAGGGDSQYKEFLRFLRVVRLLRLLKMAGIIAALMKRIKSESVIILLGIMKLIVFIMCVNHVIACLWYWVGLESAKASVHAWIEENDMRQASVGYQYTTSLHWSLTQFTPASMEVVPENTMERTYNVITLIFAMVTFSSFVSSITNAMTRLRNLNYEKMEQHSVLRQYLVENNISIPLTTAVCGFVERGLRYDGQRTHSQDVKILRDLPKILQDELQDEVYTPILTIHPFFYGFYSTYPKGMARLYRFAMLEVPLSCGAELFNIGEEAKFMFFMITGNLMYSMAATGYGSQRGEALHPPCWFSEQALWIDWRHCGQAVATSHAELLAVKADRFQSIVCRELVGVFEPKVYAKLFADYADTLASNFKLNDLCKELSSIEDIADEVWGLSRERNSRSSLQPSESTKGKISSVVLAMRRTFSSSTARMSKSMSRSTTGSNSVPPSRTRSLHRASA